MIRVNQIDLTPSIKAFIEEKLDSIARHLPPKEQDLADAKVEVGKPSKHHHSGAIYYSEINFKIGKQLLRAEAVHDDLYTAINLTREEIEQQIRKLKTKQVSARRKLRTK